MEKPELMHLAEKIDLMERQINNLQKKVRCLEELNSLKQ